MKKQTSFKEELKKSLILHALTPCFIFIFFCLVITFAYGTYNISRDNKKSAKQYADRLNQVFQEYYSKTEDTGKELNVKDFQENREYQVSVISDIYQFLNQQEVRGDFYLFDPDLNCIYTSQVSEGLRQVILEQVKGKKQVIPGNTDPYIYFFDDHDLSLDPVSAYMILLPLYDGNDLEGICGYVIQMNQFQKLANENNSNIVVVNPYFRILTSTGGRFADERGKLAEPYRTDREIIRVNKRYYHTAVFSVSQPKITIYSFLDCTFWFDVCTTLIVMIILTGIFITLSILISAASIAEKRTAIIYDLVSALQKVEKGDLNVSLDVESNDEFRFIGGAFNMMIGSIRHLIERHQEMAKENTLAAVQVMESQFNPHFLFNTLESIRYMVLIDPASAEQMIVSLSRMLRYCIKHDREMVTLQEELNVVNQYSKIMMLRYGSRLSVEIKTGEGTESLMVPRMILQPLLENSIKYGYGDQTVCMHIRLETKQQKDVLYIKISDDGQGIEPELLGILQENLAGGENRTEHIGLYNIHRRILLLYGKDYGLTLKSSQGTGTDIILKIPVSMPEESKILIE
jgi:two-component system sensor histidine kinase YesM